MTLDDFISSSKNHRGANGDSVERPCDKRGHMMMKKRRQRKKSITPPCSWSNFGETKTCPYGEELIAKLAPPSQAGNKRHCEVFGRECPVYKYAVEVKASDSAEWESPALEMLNTEISLENFDIPFVDVDCSSLLMAEIPMADNFPNGGQEKKTCPRCGWPNPRKAMANKGSGKR